jgi:hypothetical protein
MDVNIRSLPLRGDISNMQIIGKRLFCLLIGNMQKKCVLQISMYGTVRAQIMMMFSLMFNTWNSTLRLPKRTRNYKESIKLRIIMVRLRSGRETTVHEDFNSVYCRHFLGGDYPNLKLYTLVQLRHLKFSLESNFELIQYEVVNNRQQIEGFLLAQWRQFHENILTISTPLNHHSYMNSFQVIMEHCNIERCEIDLDFGGEFLCNICMQDRCVGYGFRSVGVHSPSYVMTSNTSYTTPWKFLL